jgi:hypothetical protein
MQEKVVFVNSGGPAPVGDTSTIICRMGAGPGVGEGRKTVEAG